MKREHAVLTIIFLLCLAIRLFFAFQSQTFTGDEAYFNLRQIESIKDSGMPILNDDLSYGGRTFIFMPLFHYILAAFSFVMPTVIVLKLIPNIFASSLVFIIYLITMRITRNVNAALFTAFISSFIPIWLFESINTVSIHSLFVPLFFLMVYLILDLKNKTKLFIITSLFLSLLTGSALILIFCFVFYLLIMKLERIKIKSEVVESILFFSLFSAWVSFIIYKKALIENGALVIWQNVPSELFSNYFASTSILEILFMIGFIPVIAGFYVMYHYFFTEKKQSVLLLNAIALSMLLFLWLKLVQPALGITILGITFVLLFGSFFGTLLDYFDKTHFGKFKNFAIAGFFLLFILNSVIPSFIYAKESVDSSLSENELNALDWIKDNTENNSVILSRIEDGHFITSIAERRNVADTKFLLIDNSDDYFKETNVVLDTRYKTNGIRILTKYNADYVYVSDGTPLFYADEECFDLVYNETVLIYKSLCELK